MRTGFTPTREPYRFSTGARIFAIPGGWADACLLAVPGDFGIRAILDPIPEPSIMVFFLSALGFGMVVRRRGTNSRCRTLHA